MHCVVFQFQNQKLYSTSTCIIQKINIMT